jgi:hypothetical protein
MQPLPSHGPYFAFLSDSPILNLIGANAVGRKEIPIPGDSFNPGDCFSCIISPDGQWLAYWTGFAGEITYPYTPLDPNANYDLRLNLLNISNGTAAVVTDLLTPDYPANFDKLMDAIVNQPGYDPNGSYDPEGSFLQGIRSVAWSPDSRFLAFAGEMNGPSSDLYVYDVSEKTIRRLSSGLANITADGPHSIRWSPDGKWIVYSSGYWWGEGMTVTFYAARPDGSAYREYPEEETGFAGWLSDSVFLVTWDENGIGSSYLEGADLESGRMSTIWKCQYSDIAFDPGSSLLVSDTQPIESNPECSTPGLYFRQLPAGFAHLVTGLEGMIYYNTIDFLGLGDLRYLVSDSEWNAYSVSSAGKSTLLISEELTPFIAPDRRWVAFAGKGLRIMDSSGEISAQLTGIQIDDVFWRPDSKGFLFLSGSDLYTVSLPEKTFSKIDGVPYPSNTGRIYWQPDSQGYFFNSGTGLYFLSLPKKSIEFIQQLPPSVEFVSFDPAWVAAPN